MSKCPKCDHSISRANAEGIALDKPKKSGSIRGMVVTCPNCGVILSISVDPYALMEEIRKVVKRS